MVRSRWSFGSFYPFALHFVVFVFIHQLHGKFPLLKGEGIVFGGENYVEHNVSMDLNRAVFTVSENFLSVAIDSGIMRHHWHGINFTSEKFFTLAVALSPAYLRIGGTSEDFLIYKGSSGWQRTLTNFTITSEDLDKIHELSSKAGWDVLFGLNVLLREKDGSWNASNAKKIMQYVAEHDFRFGWELGNEPDLYPRHINESISPEQLAEDFKTLRAILESSPQFGKCLVGPDITTVANHSGSAVFLESFVKHAKDVIDAVTWHQYYVDGRTCSEEDFYKPHILDHLLHELKSVNYIMDKYGPGIPRWLGETSSAFGGGAPGLSDRYVAGFMWLDKLGLAARLYHSVIVRQTFVRGHYSLLDEDLNPNPDYWLSLLYKRLVGAKVLHVDGGTEEKRKIRVYAHCSSRMFPAGSITLLALNVHQHDPVLLSLPEDLQGKDVEEYLLMPSGGDLTSTSVMLNGRVLKLVDDRTLPDLTATITAKPLILPPLSFGLYVVPDAKAKACS